MKHITVEPHWPGMRRWVLAMYQTDPDKAREIAAQMGCEAPELPEEEQRVEA
ncbi:MAG: hypothetical protein BWY85_00726 [Firmicutes bacterium ADurb.Bin506]|nr:MAG: hypothetical protein BWY85_00726 [Firmicutes bacterium ADurb.Bin506]